MGKLSFFLTARFETLFRFSNLRIGLNIFDFPARLRRVKSDNNSLCKLMPLTGLPDIGD